MARSSFLESVRTEIRTRHYSLRTEKSYLYWIRHFIIFNDKRHPEKMGNAEIEHFLNYLAVDRKVSSATQNQALCAIIFMYRHIIKREIEGLNYGFAKQPRQLPSVLAPIEVQGILEHLRGKYWLLAALLYGCGFRVSEVLSLRVKDIGLQGKSILVFRGKGRKDRYTLLPESLVAPIKQQLLIAQKVHQRDLDNGYGLASIESSLKRKYGNSLKDFSWQYVFPSNLKCVKAFCI